MPISDGSVSFWISQSQDGNTDAQVAIWHRFHRKLLRLAAQALPPSARREADEEDVVNLAFQSFFRRLSEGEFPNLENREDLGRLLRSITRRKAILLLRRARCGKRRQDEMLLPEPVRPLDEFEAGVPTPEAIAIEEEKRQALLALLDDDLRQIAECKYHGLTNEEIAAEISRSIPTVERRVRLIRQKWNDALAGAES